MMNEHIDLTPRVREEVLAHMGLMGMDPFEAEARENGIYERYEALCLMLQTHGLGLLCSTTDIQEFELITAARNRQAWSDVHSKAARKPVSEYERRERIENHMMSDNY